MNTSFEALISSYSTTNIGIANHFFPDSLAESLKEHLLQLKLGNQLRPAGMGNADRIINDKGVRGDSIYWLDRLHKNDFENAFLDYVDAFVVYLNTHCYTGIKSHEFHFAYYETGSFYKKHLDQFQNNQSRSFSMITYLNTDWQLGDGGELCIHGLNALQLITPTIGKTVFFKSNEIEHEVLQTNKSRLSITGWLKTS